MAAQGPHTVKLSDLQSLKRAAEDLLDLVKRNADSPAMTEAIKDVESAVTKVLNGMKPSTGPTTIQRCHVDARSFRSLPVNIRGIKSSTVLSRGAQATPGNNTLAVHGGSMVYDAVKRRLNDIGRPDLLLR